MESAGKSRWHRTSRSSSSVGFAFSFLLSVIACLNLAVWTTMIVMYVLEALDSLDVFNSLFCLYVEVEPSQVGGCRIDNGENVEKVGSCNDEWWGIAGQGEPRYVPRYLGLVR